MSTRKLCIMPRKLSPTSFKSHGLRKAARAAGSYTELAKRLRITVGAISHWTKVPEKYVLRIEKQTGVARELLRPDLYR